jgi:ribosomal protein S18 acetylase RimI-like enzyme
VNGEEALDDRAAALGVRLQVAGEQQLDDLEPLWLALFDHHLTIGAAGLPVIARESSWPRRRHRYQQLLAGPDAFVIIARRDDGTPVGYVLAHVHEGADDTWPTGERIGDVESLAVLPAARGRGLGSLLLDAAEARLLSAGARDVQITVMAGNEDADRFYRRRGMTPVLVTLLRLGTQA